MSNEDIEVLKKNLGILTNCTKWVDKKSDDSCIKYFKYEQDYCRECKNKKLIEKKDGFGHD